MEFTDELDEYVVLRLPLDSYKPSARALEAGFHIAGGEVRSQVRRTERELLRASFRNWSAPYDGKLNGWREDSPIYALYEEKLVGGVYVCDQNEFGESHWGQVHYAFLDPSLRGRGIYSLLFKEAIRRAQRWGVHGVILNSDRYLLPELYVKWGAIPWKTISKARAPAAAHGTGRFLSRPIRALTKRLRRLFIQGA